MLRDIDYHPQLSPIIWSHLAVADWSGLVMVICMLEGFSSAHNAIEFHSHNNG